MSDKLKTWPENMYLDEFGGQSATYDPVLNGVHYIRADIAKDREAKLIEMTIDSMRGADDDYQPIVELIYIAAKLKELK